MSCFECPLWSMLEYMQWKANGKQAAHVNDCRKVNSKLLEITDCFIAFFFSIQEFGQHNWLTEELIRGHTGHETGNCHPAVGTSLGLYSWACPGIKGANMMMNRDWYYCLQTSCPSPLSLVNELLSGECSSYYFPFPVQCLYFFSPAICCQWILMGCYCLLFVQRISSLEHSIKVICYLHFLTGLGRQVVLVLL